MFEVHNPDKFIDYAEVKTVKGFSLPCEEHSKIYLLDDNDGYIIRIFKVGRFQWMLL